MAKTKDKKLYSRLRSSGVRKKVARELTALPGEVKSGKAAEAAARGRRSARRTVCPSCAAISEPGTAGGGQEGGADTPRQREEAERRGSQGRAQRAKA